MAQTTKPLKRSIVFFLIPNFSMIAFATAIEPLRIANRMLGYEAYRWRLASVEGTPIAASNGVEVAVNGSLADERRNLTGEARPSMVFVCSGIRVDEFYNKSVNAWLREEFNRGVSVGGLCTGAYVLATAGLLSGKRCAIHWENLPGFAEKFPNADVYADLYEVDGNIYTCAGGTAALDMMLNLIGEDHDDNLVNRICEQALTDRVRNPHDRQRLAPARTARRPEFQGPVHHRTDGSEPVRAAFAHRDRGICRALAAPDRTAVPPGNGPFAGTLLPGDPPRPGAPPAGAVLAADRRGGRGMRLRLGLALLQVLPRALRAVAPAGTGRPEAAPHRGLTAAPPDAQ